MHLTQKVVERNLLLVIRPPYNAALLGVGVIGIVTFVFWSVVLMLSPRTRYVGAAGAVMCVVMARQVFIMWKAGKR